MPQNSLQKSGLRKQVRKPCPVVLVKEQLRKYPCIPVFVPQAHMIAQDTLFKLPFVLQNVLQKSFKNLAKISFKKLSQGHAPS